MKESNIIDMTRGKPLPLLVRFAVPIMLGSMFQQLYNFVDTAIVGRFIGMEALSAVGITSPLNFLVLGFVINCTVGFCIPISQSVGAGNRRDVNQYFWNGLYICLFLGVVIGVGSGALAVSLLKMLNTPSELLGMATSYISVIFYGQIVTVIYNYLAGTLRAFGDSKRPFYFLLVSCGLNIILDLLLIVVVPMGVTGAAVATVISQALSAVLCILWLVGRRTMLSFNDGGKFYRLSWSHVKRACLIGLPLGLEASVCSIGNLILQGAINTMGVVAVAAQTCAERIRFIFTLPMESMGSAMATYVGQNYGAKNLGRIREGVRSGLSFQIIYSLAAWGVLFGLKKPLVYLLLGDGAPAETDATLQYLSIISTLFIFHGSLMIFRYSVQGMGYSSAALFSAVMEIIGRSFAGFAAVKFNSFPLICLSSPIAWILALGYCVIIYRHYINKTKREWTRGQNVY